MKTWKQRLIAHLAGDGTINDLETDAFYREANKVPDDVETDLESVERWVKEEMYRRDNWEAIQAAKCAEDGTPMP